MEPIIIWTLRAVIDHMAGIREIKLRIKSIRETQQITKAMKLISAVKLKKAKQQLDQTRPFFTKVLATMEDILEHSAGVNRIGNIFFDEREEKENRTTGIIVLTGDKNLAGGYNHNILKLAEAKMKQVEHPVLYVAGHVGKSFCLKRGYPVNQDFDYPVQNPTMYRAREITDMMLAQYKSGGLDEVYVVYTYMVSSMKLEPKVTRLLPLDLDALKEDLGMENTRAGAVDRSITYEPSPNAVFETLVPMFMKGIIYGAFVEAFTSEQSARMTAMDNATTNADEMLQKLSLRYNRARQAAITQEISEIVSGASAL